MCCSKSHCFKWFVGSVAVLRKNQWAVVLVKKEYKTCRFEKLQFFPPPKKSIFVPLFKSITKHRAKKDQLSCVSFISFKHGIQRKKNHYFFFREIVREQATKMHNEYLLLLKTKKILVINETKFNVQIVLLITPY